MDVFCSGEGQPELLSVTSQGVHIRSRFLFATYSAVLLHGAPQRAVVLAIDHHKDNRADVLFFPHRI